MSTELPLSTNIMCTLLLSIMALMTRASQWGWRTWYIVRMANMVCVHLPYELFSWPLVRRVRIHEQSFPCFSNIAVLDPSRLPIEVRSAEGSPDLVRGSRLTLVIVQLGAFVADVISEVPFTDEFFDLILEHNAFLSGVADIFVIPVILVLIPFWAVSS